MRKLKVVSILSLLLFASLSTYGTVEVERISANANWLARFDCQKFHKSLAGEVLKNQIEELNLETKLKDFAIVFGFKPLEDVRSIMLYGEGRDRDKAVLLIEGKFDKFRLTSLIETNPQFQEIAYNNITILQWQEKIVGDSGTTEETIMCGCFYKDELILLSSGLPALKNAIDVLNGTQKSTSNELFKDPLLYDSNAYFQLAVADISQLVGSQPDAAIFKQTEQLIIGVGQDSENVFAEVSLKAKSQKTAENIRKMIDGIIALFSLAGGDYQGLENIEDLIQVETNYDKVNIRVELKPELVEKIIEISKENI